MPFLSEAQLESMKFKKLGRNVKISDKASIYNAELIEIGDDSRVDDFCVLSGRIVLGRNVHIAVHCNLLGGDCGIEMEDFSGLSFGCQVFAKSDDYTGAAMTNPTVPEEFKKVTSKPVRISRHSIVGTYSLIFPGVTLGEGTAVGAMSVVTSSTEPWSLYLGHPARRARGRKRTPLELERRFLESRE